MNRPFEKVTPEQFDLLYCVNVRAPFFLTQALLPELEKSRGVVLNLSSIHAYEGYTEHSVYAGTRGAMVSFTRQLAIELAPRGVRVNTIAPCAVPVPNHFKSTPEVDPEQSIRELGNAIPCGFAGVPGDIANVALFLASDAARYIVGQTLIVDGGTTSWMPFGEQFKQPMTAQFGQGYVPGL
jgi:NAD(P)-dependent dehydrogenase (short-subunit alcohol dehydrogenase family)